MAKTPSEYQVTKSLIKGLFLDKTKLNNMIVRLDLTPEAVRDERGTYKKLHDWLWPKETLIGDIFDFFSRAAYANEATQWAEFGRADGVAFMRVQFNSPFAAENLAFNLLGQSGLRAVVEDHGDGLYHFEFEE
jgi:hypothetical protein